MATLAFVVDQVRRRLEPGYKSKVVTLNTDVTDDDQSLPVDDASQVTTGSVVEIDSELMRVKAVDTSTNTIQLYSFGRGYNSTTAAAHTAGSMVVIDPDYPFSDLVDLMNSVVSELYSQGLTAIGSFESPYSWNEQFVLPNEAVTPIGVHVFYPELNAWQQTYSWRHDPLAGDVLWIGHVPDGYSVRVTYTTEPQALDPDQPTEDFYTLTGYNQRIADVVALGVAYRVATLRANARLNKMSAQSSADAQAKPISEGRLLGQVLYAEFTQRVQAELQAQRREAPASLHRTR